MFDVTLSRAGIKAAIMLPQVFVPLTFVAIVALAIWLATAEEENVICLDPKLANKLGIKTVFKYTYSRLGPDGYGVDDHWFERM